VKARSQAYPLGGAFTPLNRSPAPGSASAGFYQDAKPPRQRRGDRMTHSARYQFFGRNYQADVLDSAHIGGMKRKIANIDIRVEPQLVEKIDA
jgi:hypothetical protein